MKKYAARTTRKQIDRIARYWRTTKFPHKFTGDYRNSAKSSMIIQYNRHQAKQISWAKEFHRAESASPGHLHRSFIEDALPPHLRPPVRESPPRRRIQCHYTRRSLPDSITRRINAFITAGPARENFAKYS
jgi:hypothetical protein